MLRLTLAHLPIGKLTHPHWKKTDFLGGGGGGGQYDPTPSYTTAGKYLVVVQISNEPLEYKRQREEVT